MWLMQLGEVIFGGVGSGLYGMIVFAIVAVFVAGLMIGRTPEYLGKKIEAFEIKMSAIVVLVPLVVVLGRNGDRRDGRCRQGRRRQSRRARLLRDPLRVLLGRQQQRQRLRRAVGEHALLQHGAGLAMLFSRYWLVVPTLALAGRSRRRRRVPVGAGTLPTHTPLFVFFLIGVVVIVGALTFIPALALGPIVEHLMLYGAPV